MANLGGVPPFTGFMIKVRALGYLRTERGLILLAASGLSLVTYTRIAVAARLR